MRAGGRAARAAAGRRRLDRHDQAGGRRAPRWTPARRIVNDVSAFRFAPEMAGLVADAGVELLPHAHARRAAHDAGGPALRRRRRGGEGLPRGAAGVRGRRGGRRGARLARSRHRLRQDRGAQPRAAAAPGRDRRDRPAGGDRHLAQELPRQARRRAGRGRAPARHDRDERAGARARRHDIPRARRGARSPMPWRSPLLRSRP